MSGPNAGLPKIGAHANAWNAVAVGANGLSAIFDLLGYDVLSAFGNAGAATTIQILYSQDGVNFFAGPQVVLAGASDFAIDARPGARFVRLKSTGAATITATIAAK